DLRAAPSSGEAALAAAYGELGMLYHAYDLRAPAEVCYRNAARHAPADHRWPHLLGALLENDGRLDEAAAAYERALALERGDVAALVHLGEIRRLQGRPEEAESALRRALAADPASPAARSLLGQVALDRRRYREAAELLKAALAQAPDATRLHYSLALAYRGLGDRARAAEHFARAGQVGLRPVDPLLDALAGLRAGERVHVARGKTAYQAGRFAEAADEFRRALAARPESLDARIDLAAALVALGDPRTAESELREALRRDPGNPTAHFNLGALLAAAGPSDEAHEHLAAAAQALPEDAGAHRALAHELRESGRLEAAAAEYARAVELAPADDAARLEEAETLVRLARYGRARERLEDGVRSLPESGLLAHALARLLAACPDRLFRDGARARALAAAVWRAGPTPDHAETLALAEAEAGRCADAARWQRTALDALAAGAPAADARAREMRERLARYERGAPCRPGD
ncbi:MAG TPA: tetratricopeptide repeat protein, partial [Thermoanaerobaculia bacterium]|nr:tetratricopeptide repeat protein [Thermoanaerobaculia bacterium]